MLVDKLLELKVSFDNEFDMIGVELNRRIVFKKQQATEKAIYTQISGCAQAGQVWHLQVCQTGG